MNTYEIFKDKTLLRIDSPLISGWELCKDIERIQKIAGKKDTGELKEHVTWIGGKLTEEQLINILGTINKYKKREVIFILYYSIKDKKFDIKVPTQKSSAASVSCNDPECIPEKGYTMIGTIHTHPEMSAFWSSTDYSDQKGKYGIHIVLGLKDGKVSSSLCTVFTPDSSYDQDINVIFPDIDKTVEYPEYPPWVDKIEASIAKAKEEDKNRNINIVYKNNYYYSQINSNYKISSNDRINHIDSYLFSKNKKNKYDMYQDISDYSELEIAMLEENIEDLVQEYMNYLGIDNTVNLLKDIIFNNIVHDDEC